MKIYFGAKFINVGIRFKIVIPSKFNIYYPVSISERHLGSDFLERICSLKKIKYVLIVL